MARSLIAAAFALFAVSASAQQALKLDIKDGRVNLDATSVPARQILAEWARVGGTKVVGADKVTGTPLTLKLVDLSERQALDIILRNVAGYMAAPRLASATPGASAYDRILILPTSTSAASASNSPRVNMPSSPGPMAGTERRVMPPRPPGMLPRPGEQPEAREADEQPEPDDPDTGVVNQQPVFTFPQPANPGANQVFVNVPPNFGAPGTTANQPTIQLQPNANGQPTIYNFTPSTNAPPTPAGGPFQVIGSPTPGVVQQPVAPGQPVPPKPPGGLD